MTPLALIRHAPTAWNAAGRVQGRHDPPLDPSRRPAWRVPPELAGFAWRTSPLRRAVETASLLGIAECASDARLIEMDWGAWEGRILAELRAELGLAMAQNEARGLDFRPEGGESPRDVQDRLRPLLAEIAAVGQPVAAVTHKGVIRAAFALATGWDMRGKMPVRLMWNAAHLLHLDPVGRPLLHRPNLSLEAA